MATFPDIKPSYGTRKKNAPVSRTVRFADGYEHRIIFGLAQNQLVNITAKVAGKAISRRHKLDAPLGVRGRNSNNDLVREKLGWDYKQTLEEGIAKTYEWIEKQVKKSKVTEVEKELASI